MVTVTPDPAPDVASVLAEPGFAATWTGPLPRSARDEQVTAWVREQKPTALAGTLAVALEFGGARIKSATWRPGGSRTSSTASSRSSAARSATRTTIGS